MKTNKLKKIMLTSILYLFFSLLVLNTASDCQIRTRTEISFPDILGYQTLKCDFHMHTVFSDGKVWPTIRSEEIWLEGLDAFSITDHIEHQSHDEDVITNLNRSYELAKPRADELNVLITRGGEITKRLPPGHFNALFLNDVNPLNKKDYLDAIGAAVEQGAFVFWNHPGWRQPDEIPVWYDEHTKLYEKGWLHGMEIVNNSSYYPKAHQWCLDKKITMLGNSDIHHPVQMNYDFKNGEHRPFTLVFAKDRSLESIKEALFARRTAVYFENLLIGEQQYLKPIFEKSIEIINPHITIKGKSKAYVQIHNASDLTFELETAASPEHISLPGAITLYANKTVMLGLKGKSKTYSGQEKLVIPFTVKNLLIAPEKGLPVVIEILVDYMPTEKR